MDDPPPPSAPTAQSLPSTSTSFSITQAETGSQNSEQPLPNTAQNLPIVRKRKQASITTFVPKKMTFDVQKKIDEGLLKLFTKDFQPFKVVEDEGFKNFVKLLNPAYKLPDRHTISKVHIPALYEKSLNETKELINNESLSGCLTTDCWTSRNNIAFISITYHFIDTQFVLRSVLLGCYEFSESHTGEHLCDTIQETLDKWGLNKEKIILAVSDNANNIKSALSMLQVKSLGCFAHTLNLIVQDALKLQSYLIDKIKCIVTHFRKSSRANHKLNVYQTSNGSNVPKKLLQDISTRWNSTYYMLDRFVELEDAIRATLGLLDNPPQILTANEWKITKELVQVLRPFEEATKAVSGSKYMTASIIIVISQGLQNVCEQMAKKNFTIEVINVIQKLQGGMQHRDRWGSIERSRTLVRCTFLDPRFKGITLTNAMQQSTKTEIIELTAAIISESRLFDAQLQEDFNPLPQEVDEDEIVVSIWKTIDSKVAQLRPTSTTTSRAIIEVQRYLEDSIINRNCDPLKWWFDNKHNYPYLNQLARKMLCALGTSVPCERVFSKAGLLLSDRRCNLSSKKAEMLLFLNQNT